MDLRYTAASFTGAIPCAQRLLQNPLVTSGTFRGPAGDNGQSAEFTVFRSDAVPNKGFMPLGSLNEGGVDFTVGVMNTS